MGATVISTNRVKVGPRNIPADAVAVTWRRTTDNVWHYRFHGTELGARLVHARNGKAYDRATYAEWGWKTISDTDREAGLWLW